MSQQESRDCHKSISNELTSAPQDPRQTEPSCRPTIKVRTRMLMLLKESEKSARRDEGEPKEKSEDVRRSRKSHESGTVAEDSVKESLERFMRLVRGKSRNLQHLHKRGRRNRTCQFESRGICRIERRKGLTVLVATARILRRRRAGDEHFEVRMGQTKRLVSCRERRTRASA